MFPVTDIPTCQFIHSPNKYRYAMHIYGPIKIIKSNLRYYYHHLKLSLSLYLPTDQKGLTPKYRIIRVYGSVVGEE